MRVLIVEDEVKLAALLRRGLEEEAHAADVAGTGEDALWMARATEYDAIVLDLMLPGVDGIEVCRQLREAGVWSPVLMLTARDGLEDRIGGLDAGADDYLTKPFAFAELLARLRALARRGTLERPAVLEVGDLRLDPATRRVWRGDAEVELSAKEFALLETFMRRPGRVLSRYDLLEHAWDYEYERRSNVVDVYVRYLREKVDRPVRPHVPRDGPRRGVPAAPGRWRVSRLSLRLRLTLAFALAMALLLAAAGAFLYVRLGSALDEQIDSTLRTRADDVAALVRGGSRARRRGLAESDESFAQVLGPGGEVRDATPGVGCIAPAPAGRARPRPARRRSSSSAEAFACSRRRSTSSSSWPARRSRTGTTRSPPCGRSSCSAARSCCCSPRSRATRSQPRRCDRCSRGSRPGSSASAASLPRRATSCGRRSRSSRPSSSSRSAGPAVPRSCAPR